jgi:hypothetical protein
MTSPMTREEKGGVWIVGVVLVLVAVAFLRACGSQDAQIPAKTETRIDSVQKTEKPYDATKDSLRAVALRLARQRDAALARATVLVGIAQSEGARADSLALLAGRSDSSLATGAAPDSLWHRAYDARTVERDSLLVVIDSGRAIIARFTDIHRVDSARASEADRRVAALASLNVEMGKEYASANRCDLIRVIRWAIPCPTRKEAVVGGAIIGATAVAYFKR